MEIIARKAELEVLERGLQREEPQFIAVYGRRRVGKTYLIRNTFNRLLGYIEITGRKHEKRLVGLQRFAQAILGSTPELESQSEISTWREAFELVTKAIHIKKKRNQEKIVLFIDELPWLAGDSSELVNELDYAWNTSWSTISNFLLIVCGSATSWMLSKIVNNTGGLYNRTTLRLKVNPFNFTDFKIYLDSKGIRYPLLDLIELYMSVGGIPYYLNSLQPNVSLIQNTENIFFEQEGFAKNEYILLFQSLFRNYEKHLDLIHFLSTKRSGFTLKEISAQLPQYSPTALRTGVDELVACDFIKKLFPYGKRQRDARFLVSDEFVLFYNSWIKETTGISFQKNYWQLQTATPKYSAWCGYSFEIFCYKHVDAILGALGISGIISTAHIYNHRANTKNDIPGFQVDLLIDRADRIINLCEIKFSRTPYKFNKQTYDKLLTTISYFKEVVKSNKSVVPVLVSANRVIPNEYTHSVQVLEAEDLFAGALR